MVIEQRRTFTRANILKLWPFLVHDLRGLGAKIFFPHYCTGGLMHIGTRRLQQILLKAKSKGGERSCASTRRSWGGWL